MTCMVLLQGKGGEDVTMEAAKDDAAEAGFVPPESAGSGKPEGVSPLARTSEVGHLLPLRQDKT